MSYVVMVHTESAFKEYFLPAVNDSDYILKLDKNIFGMTQDLGIVMEVIKNEWKFVENEAYRILDTYKRSYAGKSIKDGDIIYIKTHNMELSLIILDCVQTFQAYDKYSLDHVTEITIGSQETNQIRYNLSRQIEGKNVEYISGHHAMIKNEAGAFWLYDYSTNGVYVNFKRVQGKVELMFGDSIAVFGLNLNP